MSPEHDHAPASALGVTGIAGASYVVATISGVVFLLILMALPVGALSLF